MPLRLLVHALLLASCGASPACITGASLACTCTDGRSGAQICQADGTLSTCICELGRDGGTSADGAISPSPDGGGGALDGGQCACSPTSPPSCSDTSVTRCVDQGGGCGMQVLEPCATACSAGMCVECARDEDCGDATQRQCLSNACSERAVWAEGTITLADGTTLPFDTNGFSDATLVTSGALLRFQMGYSVWALDLTGTETAGTQPLNDGRTSGTSTVFVSWSHLGTTAAAANDGGYGQSTGTLTLSEVSFSPTGRIAGHVHADLTFNATASMGVLDSDFAGTFPR